MDEWDILDLYKALSAIGAGVILGLERELKDKAAGLKTITVICLGSALFAMLSYKIGAADQESTRIASYIVSGVGFIGAGVIFKDGVNVSGLTTAGIIWLAAAVGTAIGFGEFFLALTFMIASLSIVLISPWLNKLFRARRQNRMLVITIKDKNTDKKQTILSAIKNEGISVEEKKLELKEGLLVISLEIVVKHVNTPWLENYLVSNQDIVYFSLYNSG
jgi:putative Mg2+ transporter-C (MgtC) family protein